MAFILSCSLGCSARAREGKGKPDSPEAPVKTADKPKAEPRSGESQSVDPGVQSALERMEAEKRATLLKDAQSALEETRDALAALDKGDKQSALAALERVSGKLDLIVARDPKMAFAPVSVTTTVLDLYATPDTVKAVVKEAKDDLANEQVQRARLLVKDLASRRELQLTEALGYGTKDSYKPLYAQLDEIQKKAEGGQPGRSVFAKLRQSLRSFKFSS
jgi:hypothetical protein